METITGCASLSIFTSKHFYYKTTSEYGIFNHLIKIHGHQYHHGKYRVIHPHFPVYYAVLLQESPDIRTTPGI